MPDSARSSAGPRPSRGRRLPDPALDRNVSCLNARLTRADTPWGAYRAEPGQEQAVSEKNMIENEEATPTHHAPQVRVVTSSSCTAAVPTQPAAARARAAAAKPGSRRGWASVGAVALGAFVVVMTASSADRGWARSSRVRDLLHAVLELSRSSATRVLHIGLSDQLQPSISNNPTETSRTACVNGALRRPRNVHTRRDVCYQKR